MCIRDRDKINAVITGVGGYVPDYVLTNDEISKMVDTTDEWIMGRIGIKAVSYTHLCLGEVGSRVQYDVVLPVKVGTVRTPFQPQGEEGEVVLSLIHIYPRIGFHLYVELLIQASLIFLYDIEPIFLYFPK